jgi:hypothetical protein
MSWISTMSIILIVILVLLATIGSFAAYTNISSTPTASATTAANNTTAKSYLLGAGFIGIFILVIYLIYFIYSMYNDFVGVGTLFLIIIMFLLLIAMTVLIIYAITLIEGDAINDTANLWARFAAAAAIMAILFEFLYAISIYYQPSELTPIESNIYPLSNAFYFTRNTNTKGKFEGIISLNGELKEPNEFIVYNGKLIENVKNHLSFQSMLHFQLMNNKK